MLPFKKIPALMIKEMVEGSVMWLNMFPPKDGVSTTISPRSLITGLQIDYHKHCRIECGAYAQTHEEHSNDMGARTIGAIALRTKGTDDGGYCTTSSTYPPVTGSIESDGLNSQCHMR